LMARGDAAGARTRAFVLALSGDINGAKSAMDAAMPGSSSNMAYFFRKLPGLRSEQKAAAVNLGIFPGSGETQVASVVPQPAVTSPPAAQQADDSSADRIGSIERWLSQATQGTATLPGQASAAPPPQQVASVSLPSIAATQRMTTSPLTAKSKVWIQLASGPNSASLPDEFSRIKKRNRELLNGINGYIVEEPGRARLLIGPFRNSEEANIFAEDLASVRVDAFTWTNQPGQAIRKLPTE
jgi:hypothetical protein